MKDERSQGISSLHQNFILMTGCWRMVDGDGGIPHILAMDNFMSVDKVLDVTIMEDCEVIDGESLLMYTRVALEGQEFSLVVIKSRVYAPDGEEA